jgi:hypothetical protein
MLLRFGSMLLVPLLELRLGLVRSLRVSDNSSYKYPDRTMRTSHFVSCHANNVRFISANMTVHTWQLKGVTVH